MTTPDFPRLLQQHFGFSEFRPGQVAVLNALDAHKAALAVFPTGGGKSLCYQLPALAYDGLTLVVSPLLALMKDQIDFLRSRGVAAARLDSTQTAADSRQVYDDIESGALKILYVAPERFNNERFLSRLASIPLALFAVDEAHCISEWGHNFRPDYLKLAETARALKAERVLALTATATPSVVKDICKAFGIRNEAAIVTGFSRPNLNLAVTAVTDEQRDAVLLKRLQARKPGSGIVYVTLQKTAERVAGFLTDNGIAAEAYHAGMKDDERVAVQDRWKASDRGLVVATIAFGMGIDKADVRYVYHYNLPKSLESYSQEIGRAGRDGQPSVVELLACADDVPTLENFAYGDTPTDASVRGLLDELLSAGTEFDISQYDLAFRHDLRFLVLRTALTYLELLGVLEQGTPFYAGYEVNLKRPLPEIAQSFAGTHGQFIQNVFSNSKKGIKWYAVSPDPLAETLGVERRRIVRALEVLEEKGWAEIKAADVRQRYTRLRPTEDRDALLAELMARFEKREANEITRTEQVLGLLTLDACLTNALAAHFGETHDAPCGHCSHCKTGRAVTLPQPHPAPPIEEVLDTAQFETLRRTHPDALGAPRQAARFLCGLTSPALTRAKLGRNPLFGSLEAHRFADVLAWCAAD